MVKLRLKFIVLLLLAFAVSAPAYTVQYADKAKTLRLRWKTNTIDLAVSRSLQKPSPLVTTSKGELIDALNNSLQHWKDAADINFNIIWMDKTDVSAAGIKGDGISLITIADTPDNILFFDGEPNTAAKTRIFFNGRSEERRVGKEGR